MPRRRPYGFSVLLEGQRKVFRFGDRVWSLLMNDEPFSQLGTVFRRLIGADALEFVIGHKRYALELTRTKEFFLQQCASAMRVFDAEKDLLASDYRLKIPGYDKSWTRSKLFEFMGHTARATCTQGFSSLEVQKNGLPMTLIDLRRFESFDVDGGKSLAIKAQKTHESEILPTLEEASNFVENNDAATCVVAITGGDS